MAEARESYERSIACHRDYGSWLVGLALGQLGDLEREEHRLDVARSHYGEALMIARPVRRGALHVPFGIDDCTACRGTPRSSRGAGYCMCPAALSISPGFIPRPA